ncbi:chaperone J-domain-containing protein [Wolfiporia cocos MD-104 SS10]|uniref:Chaperone J-domain-containing protein n=1 Tax=Wolfiporia cocos (strain MD-104) TaxID=742152 RepID=A0A2H3J2Z0_WOLCO|nr:chaperone J-domain-containing protein [Wolfiporia cocos MD-104 SS10]
MLVPILSMLGWMYLPDIVTRQILRFFHRFLNYTLRRPIPPPNTPQYWQQYRYTYALVITGYVVFHSRAVARSTKPNYYEMLGVDPSADENALKVAFRQFARKKHPDRVGPEGEALFIEVRDAFEALKNPVTRFAYDRFGSEALEWDHCSTPLDYIRYGLMQSAGFHAISAAALVLLSVIGGPSQVSYVSATVK